MKLFDAHVHADNGLDGYDGQAAGRNIIFNTVDQYRKKASLLAPTDRLTLIFDFKSELPFILSEIKSNCLDALKIHSRVQKLRETDYPELIEQLAQVPSSLPIIVDAFYHGPDLEIQPNLKGILKMIETYPDRSFVIAHAGGHHVLDYLFHLRGVRNVYFELSASLHFFADSALYNEFKRLISFSDSSRVMFGSDYPYFPVASQRATLEKMSNELQCSAETQEKFFYDNAQTLFSSHRLPR